MRRTRGPQVVHVVVPVRDEERTLGRCLGAIATSLDLARRRRPDLVGRVTVVLDSCRDASADVARSHGADVVPVDARSVGVARGVGVERARGAAPGVEAARLWVATTDGDSLVPPGWLEEQLGLAERGSDLVVGRVSLDPAEVSVEVRTAWLLRHPHEALHVFGASLGFRLSAYDRAGGFEPVREHEDVALVHRMIAAGSRWGTGTLPVVTSARTAGRTPGGFAGYLRDLDAEVTGHVSGHGSGHAPCGVSPSTAGRS